MSAVVDDVLLNNTIDGGIIDFSAISGGPEASTSIVSNPISGVSQRNVNRLDKLHRFTVHTSLLTPEELSELREFWHCRDGMARGFKMRDMTEFWASSDGTMFAPIGTPNQFGTGNGATTIFGLYKTYSSGGQTRTRRIIKPKQGTVSIYKNGVLQTVTTHYTIDYETGIITFVAAPANGHALTWTGWFYIPVRFGSDQFDPAMNDALTNLSYGNLPLIEIPPAEFDLDV
jgi:uncharacterized protein (TIGR02217 family)